MGPEAAQHIVAVRAAFGDYTSLLDFCRKVDRRPVTRHDLLLLIKVGAFGFTGVSRAGLTLAEQVFAASADLARSGDQDPQGAVQLEEDLVAGAARYLDVEEWPAEVLAAIDMAHLGFYASAPLETARQAERLAAELGAVHVAQLIDYPDRAQVTVAALITACRVRQTRKGELMAWVTLADATGAIECAVFPAAYARVAGSGVLRQGAFIAATGRLSQEEASGSKLFVDEVRVLEAKIARWGALAVTVERQRRPAVPWAN
jgi:DNA polymerase-3 subunit alpha